jgi:predicted secreted protein
MGPIWTLSIYFVVWWLTLFAILPLGAKSHMEAGSHVADGGDPGAPVNPNLKRKAFTTTWVAAILTGLIWVVVQFGLIPVPQLPA